MGFAAIGFGPVLAPGSDRAVFFNAVEYAALVGPILLGAGWPLLSAKGSDWHPSSHG